MRNARDPDVPALRRRIAALAWAWRFNWRLGWPERQRGLHYWLGFEYALLLSRLPPRCGGRWLDVGSGAHSIWPYLLARHCAAQVVAIDVAPEFAEQVHRRDRAERAGLCAPGDVQLVRGDARRLPFESGTFDGFTAVSALEHVTGLHGDRQALPHPRRCSAPSSNHRSSGSMAGCCTANGCRFTRGPAGCPHGSTGRAGHGTAS